MSYNSGVEIWNDTTIGYAIPTAIGIDGAIYAANNYCWPPSVENIFYAINPYNGATEWTFSPIIGWAFQNCPAVGPDGTVYLDSGDTYFYALDHTTGLAKWKFPGPQGYSNWQYFTGSPIYDPNGTLYITEQINGNQFIWAVENNTGVVKWFQSFPSCAFEGVALSPNNTLYFTTAPVVNKVIQPGYSLYAINSLNGQTKWVHTSDNWIRGQPCVAADGSVYVEEGTNSTLEVDYLNAFSEKSDAQLWSYQLPLGVLFNYYDPIISPDGGLMFSTNSGLYCFDSVYVTSITVNPSTVVGGSSTSGTITLNAPAPSGGSYITFASSSVSVTAPSPITIPGGQTTATFAISTSAVSAQTTANLQVYPGRSQVATLTINPPNLIGISLDPTTVPGGTTSTGTVTISSPAGTNGMLVSLASSDPTAKVPTSVSVPQGQTSTNFKVKTIGVNSQIIAAITASIGSQQFSQNLTITPATLASVALNPASVLGGVNSTGTVTLNGIAGVGGTVVGLNSSNVSATVPNSISIAAGQSSTTFTVSTVPVATSSQATVTATLGSITQTATLKISAPVIASVTLTPSTVQGGSTSTATVKLSGSAPAAGLSLSLSSSSAVATVPSTVLVAGGSNSTTFSIATVGVGSLTTVTISASLNGVSQTATLTISPAGLASLSLSPTTVQGGSPSTGTANLSGPAGPGGMVVSLTSNVADATVPPTVTVPQGASSANFTVSTTGVNVKTTAVILGTLSGINQSASLSINPVSLISIGLAPTTVVGGTNSTATVTLSGPAAIGGTPVTLSSSTNSVTVPGTVTVPFGQSSTTVTVQTAPVASPTSATITASLNGVTQTATLAISTPVLASVSLNPPTVAGPTTSTGTVTLTGPAPVSGINVLLTSSSSSAKVPFSVVVPYGQSSVTFTITSAKVTTPTSITITASANFVTKTATLTDDPIDIASLTLSPTEVNGGSPSIGTVTLNGVAPKGGLTVHLKSSLSAASVSGSVTVLQGQTSITFPVKTSGVSSQKMATITASYGAVALTAELTIDPPVLTSISFNPTSVASTKTAIGTVTLSGTAPSTGIVVKLSSINGAVTVPVSVTIGSGKSFGTFTAKTASVPTATSATVTATLNGTSETSTLTVTPPTIVSVTLSPTSVVGGKPSTGKITISTIAPAGGLVVTLSAGQSDGSVPASVTIPAGKTSATFTVTTGKVSTKTSATITATAGGTSKSAVLTIT
jgi:outer membrane protein assembly factor BamB